MKRLAFALFFCLLSNTAHADPTTRDIQIALRDLGYTLDVDGQFGSGTRDALGAFQRRSGLPVTGEFDGPTRNALFHESDPREDEFRPQDGGDYARPSSGRQCLEPVTATGSKRLGEGRAMNSAEKAWKNKVATLEGAGLNYIDLTKAQQAKKDCTAACAECISKVCTITAIPCK